MQRSANNLKNSLIRSSSLQKEKWERRCFYLMYVLENANCRRCDNQEIINIIMDEAAPLFAGEKTADEVAMLIDNRVALLLSEIN